MMTQPTETFDTIAQWADDTFGPCKPWRTFERASEEMVELFGEALKNDFTPQFAEEAADVVICLARVPGLWDAVERKMLKNRKRRWHKKGDGTGYHIKD